MHADDSDLTINICLGGDFTGSHVCQERVINARTSSTKPVCYQKMLRTNGMYPNALSRRSLSRTASNANRNRCAVWCTLAVSGIVSLRAKANASICCCFYLRCEVSKRLLLFVLFFFSASSVNVLLYLRIPFSGSS